MLHLKPAKGNAYIILAHQYIAANLSRLNGASAPAEVLDALSSATILLEAYASALSIPKSARSDRARAIALAELLEDYNSGAIGPGHCDDGDEPPGDDGDDGGDDGETGTHTQGYWKNHSSCGNASHKRDAGWDNLPQAEDTPFFDSDTSWCEMLQRKPKKGNAYITLAHQYIAATLNRLNGAPAPAEVMDALESSAILLEAYSPALSIPKGSRTDRARAIALARILARYNGG